MANAKLGYWFDKYVLLPLCVLIVVGTVGIFIWMKIEQSRQAHHESAVSWQLLIDSHASIQRGEAASELRILAAQGDVTLYGYMYPLETAETHTNFLLISHSASCPFHQLSGQGNVVEVRAPTAIAHRYEPFLIKGRLHIAEQASADIQYRLDDAILVTP